MPGVGELLVEEPGVECVARGERLDQEVVLLELDGQVDVRLGCKFVPRGKLQEQEQPEARALVDVVF